MSAWIAGSAVWFRLFISQLAERSPWCAALVFGRSHTIVVQPPSTIGRNTHLLEFTRVTILGFGKTMSCTAHWWSNNTDCGAQICGRPFRQVSYGARLRSWTQFVSQVLPPSGEN